MPVPLQNVTAACFGLSYLLAFGLELARLRWPRPGLRTAGLALGGAGLVAHSAFLAFRLPTPAGPYGSLLAVAWVLAVFTLIGTVRHGRQAWAVFGFPLVLGLVGLALLEPDGPGARPGSSYLTPDPLPLTPTLWGAVHGGLLLLAAVGLSVGFLASVMYLVQAARVRAKSNPLGRFRMLSLERLEAMNRRAVGWAFVPLTLGLALGAVLMSGGPDPAGGWASVKVVGTAGLWVAFVVLFYLRYAAHVPGRRLAGLTVLAFGLLLVTLAAAHPAFGGGEGGKPASHPPPPPLNGGIPR